LRVYVFLCRHVELEWDGRDEDSQSHALKKLRYRLRATTLMSVVQKTAIGVSIDLTETGAGLLIFPKGLNCIV